MRDRTESSRRCKVQQQADLCDTLHPSEHAAEVCRCRMHQVHRVPTQRQTAVQRRGHKEVLEQQILNKHSINI